MSIHLATIDVTAQTLTSAIITSNDECSSPSIELITLTIVPKQTDKAVILMGSFQILFPLAMMRIVISLTKLHEKQLGMLLEKRLQGMRGSNAVLPYLFAHPKWGLVIHQKSTALVIQDVRHHIPTCHSLYPAMIRRTVICLLQDGAILIILLAVVKILPTFVLF